MQMISELFTPNISKFIKEKYPLGQNPELEAKMRKIFYDMVVCDIEQLNRANSQIVTFINQSLPKYVENWPEVIVDNFDEFYEEKMITMNKRDSYLKGFIPLLYEKTELKKALTEGRPLFDSIKNDAFAIHYCEFLSKALGLNYNRNHRLYFEDERFSDSYFPKKFYPETLDDPAIVSMFRIYLQSALGYEKPFFGGYETIRYKCSIAMC